MPFTKVGEITIKLVEGMIEVRSPYSEALKEAIKRLPWKDRNWDQGAWWTKPEHLEQVRQAAIQVAEDEGWKISDYTAKSEAEIKQEQAVANAEMHEAHVKAVLDVLPLLPPYSLALNRWKSETLTLSLRTFIDEKIFKQLRAASLEAFKPWIRVSFDFKGTWSWSFNVAADVRIVRALCELTDSNSWSNNVQHLRLIQLELESDFGDVGHFRDDKGATWIGAKYQRVNMSEFDFSSHAWPLTMVGTAVYIVFEREPYIKAWLNDTLYQPIYFGGSSAIASTKKSEIVRLIELFHIKEWFKEWATALLQADVLATRGGGRLKQWSEAYWEHPAERLINHFGVGKTINGGNYVQRGKELLDILGWDADFLVIQKEAIKAKRQAAAAQARETAIQNVAALAQPVLNGLTKSELLKLAEDQGIPVKKSANKPALVLTLAANPSVAQHIIGLNK